MELRADSSFRVEADTFVLPMRSGFHGLNFRRGDRLLYADFCDVPDDVFSFTNGRENPARGIVHRFIPRLEPGLQQARCERGSIERHQLNLSKSTLDRDRKFHERRNCRSSERVCTVIELDRHMRRVFLARIRTRHDCLQPNASDQEPKELFSPSAARRDQNSGLLAYRLVRQVNHLKNSGPTTRRVRLGNYPPPAPNFYA